MRTDLHSQLPLKDWRGDLTMFEGAFRTIPCYEHENIEWPHVCAVIASPEGPARAAEKEKATYFLPCLLRDAPLVGRTLERALANSQPTIGKQRSAAHVTRAC